MGMVKGVWGRWDLLRGVKVAHRGVLERFTPVLAELRLGSCKIPWSQKKVVGAGRTVGQGEEVGLGQVLPQGVAGKSLAGSSFYVGPSTSTLTWNWGAQNWAELSRCGLSPPRAPDVGTTPCSRRGHHAALQMWAPRNTPDVGTTPRSRQIPGRRI